MISGRDMRQDPNDDPKFWGRAFRKDAWPENGGGSIGRKLFKFGEKAVFVEDFPFRGDAALYKMGEEYPTLGSTEIKVLLINKKGQLDLIPFFAVQNTGKLALWFSLKWWLKIWLDKHNLRQSTGRFASSFSHYKPGKLDSSATRGFYIGELLRFKKPYPPLKVENIYQYQVGETYPTLGIYTTTKDILFFENLKMETRKVSASRPGALIVDALGRFDLIPLDYIESTGNYNVFFTIEYYIKILWSRFIKKLNVLKAKFKKKK